MSKLFKDSTAQLILTEMQNQNEIMNALVTREANTIGDYNDATTRQILAEIKAQNAYLSQILNRANETDNNEPINQSYLAQMLIEMKKQSDQLQDILNTGTWSINGAPLPPNDGKEYVMKDGEWVELEPLVTPNYYPSQNDKPAEPVIQEEDGKYKVHYFFPYKFATTVITDLIKQKIGEQLIFPYDEGTLESITFKCNSPNGGAMNIGTKIVTKYGVETYTINSYIDNSSRTTNINHAIYKGDKIVFYTTSPYMEIQNITIDVEINIGKNASLNETYIYNEATKDLQPNIYIIGTYKNNMISDSSPEYTIDAQKTFRMLKTPSAKRIHTPWNNWFSMIDSNDQVWVSNIPNHAALLNALGLAAVPSTPIQVPNQNVIDVVFLPRVVLVIFKDGSAGLYNYANASYYQTFNNFKYQYNHLFLENSNMGNKYVTQISTDRRGILAFDTVNVQNTSSSWQSYMRTYTYNSRTTIDKDIRKISGYYFITDDGELYYINTLYNNIYDNPSIGKITFNYGRIKDFWTDNRAIGATGNIYVLNEDNELFITSNLTDYPTFMGMEKLGAPWTFSKIQQFTTEVKDVQCYTYYNNASNTLPYTSSSTFVLTSDGKLYHAGRDYSLDLDHTRGYFEQVYPEFKFHEIRYSCDTNVDTTAPYTLMDGSTNKYGINNSSLMARGEYLGDIIIPDRKVISLVHFNNTDNTITDENTDIAWEATNLNITTSNAKFERSMNLTTNRWAKRSLFELGGTDFTIDFWARINTASQTYAPLIILASEEYDGSTGDYSSNDVEYLSLEDHSKIAFVSYKLKNSAGSIATNNANITKAFTFADNTWYHIAIVYRQKYQLLEIYINGTRYGSYNIEITRKNRYIIFGHGRAYTGTTFQWFNGMIDELRVVDHDAIFTRRFTHIIPNKPYEYEVPTSESDSETDGE